MARSLPRPVSRSTSRSSSLQFAPGVCPSHGPTLFVRRVASSTPPELLRPPVEFLSPPPPLPSAALTLPWNGGGGSMDGRCGTPPLSNRSNGAAAWPPGFTYDFDTIPPSALPPIAPPSSNGHSYADVAANRG
jgi:hypothetical protein